MRRLERRDQRTVVAEERGKTWLSQWSIPTMVWEGKWQGLQKGGKCGLLDWRTAVTLDWKKEQGKTGLSQWSIPMMTWEGK
jgi:hypothetical protein